MTEIFARSGGVEALAARIPDGASVVSPTDRNGAPMAAAFALLRRGARGLKLIGGPTSGLQADLLIGGGAAAEIETAAASLGEHGPAPFFRAAVEGGRLAVRDTTCPALHAALQAAEKAFPSCRCAASSAPTCSAPGPTGGSSTTPSPRARTPSRCCRRCGPTWRRSTRRAPTAGGNVWIGMRREAMTMAHAARRTLATVEEIVDGDLFENPDTAPGTLSSLYVEAVAEAPGGAWPVGLGDLYPPDDAALRAYLRAAGGGAPARFGPALAALLEAARPLAAWTAARPRELLAAALARRLPAAGHVAVGAVSPVPAAAALLAERRSGGRLRGEHSRRAGPLPLQRWRARIVRRRRPGAHRRLLSRRRADRRRGQRQPGRRGRVSPRRDALSGVVRLGLPVLRGPEGHPVPRGAHAAGAGRPGGFRQRAGRESAGGCIGRRPRLAGDGPGGVPLRPRRRAVRAGERPSRRDGGPRCAPPPASPSPPRSGRRRPPPQARRRWRCCAVRCGRSWRRSTPRSRRNCARDRHAAPPEKAGRDCRLHGSRRLGHRGGHPQSGNPLESRMDAPGSAGCEPPFTAPCGDRAGPSPPSRQGAMRRFSG